MGDKTDCTDYLGIMLLPTTYKILSNILLSRLPPCAVNKIIGAISVNFNIKDELLLIHSQFIKYLRKKGYKIQKLLTTLTNVQDFTGKKVVRLVYT